MIGFTPWGVVWNREELTVQDTTINYGYDIRDPVQISKAEIPQEKQDKAANLDANHSHFILVRIRIGSP